MAFQHLASNTATDSLRRRKVVEFVALDEDYDVPGEAADPASQLQAPVSTFEERLHGK
jgi:hypothetical protein